MLELDIKKLCIAQANACLSVSELAQRSGITKTWISNLIHGERKASPKTIGRLAKALNVDVDEIIKN